MGRQGNPTQFWFVYVLSLALTPSPLLMTKQTVWFCLKHTHTRLVDVSTLRRQVDNDVEAVSAKKGIEEICNFCSVDFVVVVFFFWLCLFVWKYVWILYLRMFFVAHKRGKMIKLFYGEKKLTSFYCCCVADVVVVFFSLFRTGGSSRFLFNYFKLIAFNIRL